MSEITLTKQQLEQIQADMNVHAEMLTNEEVNALAQKVNKAINLPFVSEEKEFFVFVKVIKRIDSKLYQLLPNEYYSMVKNTTDGISKEEAVVIQDRVTLLINKVVDIPILTEKHEAKLIGLVVGFIINAMVKGFKLEQVEIGE